MLRHEHRFDADRGALGQQQEAFRSALIGTLIR
jgi:hypothetical protein